MKKNYRGIGFYIGLVLIVILVWYLLGNSQDTAGAYTYAEFEKALDKDEVVAVTIQQNREIPIFSITSYSISFLVSISYTATGAELPPSAAHNTTDNVTSFDDLDSEEFSEDTPVLSTPGLQLLVVEAYICG